MAGLWLDGEVDNHVAIYGSKVAEGFSAFQCRSCYPYHPGLLFCHDWPSTCEISNHEEYGWMDHGMIIQMKISTTRQCDILRVYVCVCVCGGGGGGCYTGVGVGVHWAQHHTSLQHEAVVRRCLTSGCRAVIWRLGCHRFKGLQQRSIAVMMQCQTSLWWRHAIEVLSHYLPFL